MPAIAGRNENGVDILSVQDLAEVAIELAILVLVVFVDEAFARIAAARLNVGDGDTLHIGQLKHRLQVVGAAGPDADHAERNLFAGGDGAVAAQRHVPARSSAERMRHCAHQMANEFTARFFTRLAHFVYAPWPCFAEQYGIDYRCCHCPPPVAARSICSSQRRGGLDSVAPQCVMENVDGCATARGGRKGCYD